MSKVATIRNGVNVDELTATVAAVKADPRQARFTFRNRAKWINRAHSHSTFDSLNAGGQEQKRAVPMFLEGDEPAALLGSDLAPNAAEAALHALSSCLSVTYAYTAAAMGIDIESLSFEMEADTDLQGFLELDPKVRPGLSQMRVKVNLACKATADQVKELHAKVERSSPLLDTYRNPVEVRLNTH